MLDNLTLEIRDWSNIEKMSLAKVLAKKCTSILNTVLFVYDTVYLSSQRFCLSFN